MIKLIRYLAYMSLKSVWSIDINAVMAYLLFIEKTEKFSKLKATLHKWRFGKFEVIELEGHSDLVTDADNDGDMLVTSRYNMHVYCIPLLWVLCVISSCI